MKVYFSWDSGPYGLYSSVEDGSHFVNHPDTHEIPDELWKRYTEAREAMDKAEEEMQAIADGKES